MNIILTTIIVLGMTGIVAAVVLWFVAKRFHVYENPHIAEIEELLPGANCGSCGYSGCHAFAVACVEATSLDGIECPITSNATMHEIGEIVGLAAAENTARVAIVKCNGTCENRPPLNRWQGPRSCALEASLYVGQSDCANGCLGCGDCVAACPFDAIAMNQESGLPLVDYGKCVGCGRCVAACPRGVMDLAVFDASKPLVHVACNNHDRGPAAMKECKVSCIGCGKCVKVCPAGAVAVKEFLAGIDSEKCTGCGTCVEACPRNSITSYNKES